MAEESPPSSQDPLSNENPPTPPMEVHHHSHSSHGRKSLSAYFFEFFMLFLAVFCGFLAENQREHFVEHKRELNYMKSLLQDLKADTSFLAFEYHRTGIICNGLDSMVRIFYSPSLFDKQIDLYRMFKTYNPVITPSFNDQTISQLRSSGNMRLVRNEEIVHAISSYWNIKNKLVRISERLDNRIDFSGEYNIKIFRREYSEKAYQSGNPENSDTYIPPDAKLMTHDLNTLTEYANIQARLNGSLKIYRKLLQEMNVRGIKLIELLEKHYHI